MFSQRNFLRSQSQKYHQTFAYHALNRKSGGGEPIGRRIGALLCTQNTQHHDYHLEIERSEGH